MGVVPASAGFLEMLREETTRVGALLVFDEVITGFRVGWSGAQGRFGITPDLTCLGKIVGGGMPLAAFGGRRDLMSMIAPAGPVYQAGTLSGNPVSVAAGLATLEALRGEGTYERLDRLGRLAEERLQGVLRRPGFPASSTGSGRCSPLFFGPTEGPVVCRRRPLGHRAVRPLLPGMLEEGIYLPPSQFEAMFVSLAHDDEHVEQLAQRGRARAPADLSRWPPRIPSSASDDRSRSSGTSSGSVLAGRSSGTSSTRRSTPNRTGYSA
jgi:glutamate-1-semialdehyde 2,1-aminomutase